MDRAIDYFPILMSGVGITVTVTFFGIIVAVVAATLGGLGRLSPHRWVRTIAGIYIEFFRGTSALVQMFWIFYALPLVGIEFTPIQAGVMALGLNVGAYGAEVVRAGVQSVPRGQYEAAIALNFTKLDRFRLIIARQAIQLMMPPFNNLFISLLKGTALVSLISLADLTLRSQMLRAQTGDSLAVLGVTLLIYLALSLVITAVMRVLTKLVSYPGAGRIANEAAK